MYTCPHTAVALAVLEKLVQRGVDQEATSASSCVSTASGLKFTEFKVRYHEGAIEGVASDAREPAGLAARRLRQGGGRDQQALLMTRESPSSRPGFPRS